MPEYLQLLYKWNEAAIVVGYFIFSGYQQNVGIAGLDILMIFAKKETLCAELSE